MAVDCVRGEDYRNFVMEMIISDQFFKGEPQNTV